MVRGQYAAGAVKGAAVEGFAEDLGEASGAETFVALKAHIENWRWQGVPFYLRTGKRLAERRSEIVVQFKSVPHNIFAERGGRLLANRLSIRLQPEEYVRLQVMAKQPGLDRQGIVLREVPLDLSLTAAFAKARRRIAYERLLLDLIEGEQTLFVRRDEVEAQWRWIDAIRKVWADEGIEPKPYAAGRLGAECGDRADRARRQELERLMKLVSDSKAHGGQQQVWTHEFGRDRHGDDLRGVRARPRAGRDPAGAVVSLGPDLHPRQRDGQGRIPRGLRRASGDLRRARYLAARRGRARRRGL